MPSELIYCVPRSKAIESAARLLSKSGFTITTEPNDAVTHLLLPVPSFSDGDVYLSDILSRLPKDITVVGGNLNSTFLRGYDTVDLLQDPYYLAENAAITARCAIRLVDKDLRNANALVLGWGRIGKCLGMLLKKEGAVVTIAARKDADLAMIEALGYRSIRISQLAQSLLLYDVIFNTIPAMVLPQIRCKDDCAVYELASVPGMAGASIINARGLPGKMAPEESGRLIAARFMKLILNKEEN